MKTAKKSSPASKKSVAKPRVQEAKATPGTDAAPVSPIVPTGKVLVLRTCASDLTSRGGFQWPASGFVSAPDWDPTPRCGYGLHGLLWGEGTGSLLAWETDAKWLVVEVEAHEIVPLSDDGAIKVKFPSGIVVFCGDRLGATTYLAEHGGHGRAIVGGTATAGDSGTATAGYRGTATAGYRGTATAGDSGTATAGDSGTATAGYRGTATAGYSGTATAGDSGTATAGDSGEIRCRYWDSKHNRYRTVIGFIGEDGLEAGTSYILDESMPPRFVKKPASA